jgi:hypothetical protein
MTATIVPPSPVPVASADNELALAVDRAREYADAAQAPNTRRAYRVGWNDFATYCASHAAVPLPTSPQTVALYVTVLADRTKLATIRTYLAAIAEKHRENGLESPTSRAMVRRIVRWHRSHQRSLADP